jgi:hypothetical protein
VATRNETITRRAVLEPGREADDDLLACHRSGNPMLAVAMPLRNYSLRVAGAAQQVEEYRAPLRNAAKAAGARFFLVRRDGDDVLLNAVFEDGAGASRMLAGATEALPSERRDRLLLSEAPDRPHELSAQLRDDMLRGTTVLGDAMQAPEDLEAWEAFLADTRPRAVLELGTASGAFARWLNRRVRWFKTLDVQKPRRRTPGFIALDVLGRPDDVRALIGQAPRPFVLYCDDGNKPLEVELFAPSLRSGDFLAVHDLGTEVFTQDIPPGFAELLAAGLTGFYEKRDYL